MAMTPRVGLVCVERIVTHDEDPFPRREVPERVESIRNALKSAGTIERCVQVDARKATSEELHTVHLKEFVEEMKQRSSTDTRSLKQMQTSSLGPNSESYEAALLAVGSVVEVTTQVAQGKLAAGGCVVRPPGLHAQANTTKGSSIFNQVAIAVQIVVHKKKELGVHKVLIFDWDVHHGNGTQNIFLTDPQVLYISIHMYNGGKFFPEGNEGDFDKVGFGEGEGYNINVPLPRMGFGNADYSTIMEHIVMPVARDFNPDMVVISAGFDSASDDPLGGCKVTPDGYSSMTQQLMTLANGRVVLVLEGGYNPRSTPSSFVACMCSLLGDPSSKPPLPCNLQPDTLPLIMKVRNKHKKYWSVLETELVLRTLQEVLPSTPSPNLSAETPFPQFDIDGGLCVRAPINECGLKKQLPLQALLVEEQGLDNPMEGQQEIKTAFLADSKPTCVCQRSNALDSSTNWQLNSMLAEREYVSEGAVHGNLITHPSHVTPM